MWSRNDVKAINLHQGQRSSVRRNLAGRRHSSYKQQESRRWMQLRRRKMVSQTCPRSIQTSQGIHFKATGSKMNLARCQRYRRTGPAGAAFDLVQQAVYSPLYRFTGHDVRMLIPGKWIRPVDSTRSIKRVLRCIATRAAKQGHQNDLVFNSGPLCANSAFQPLI